jgi:putative DNA primase/helicase
MNNPLNGLELYQEITQKSKKIQASGEIAEAFDVIDPTPIEDTLLPVPAFSMDLLAPVLRQYIENVVYRKQCPSEYVAIPALIMAASLIGKGCHIKPLQKDDWRVVPNLWGGVIGDPGTMKTPACDDALMPLKSIERNAYKIYEEQMAEYQEKARDYLAQKKYLDAEDKKARKQRDTATLESLSAQYKELEKTKPKKPKLQRYKVGDVTVEKLQDMLAHNPRGLLVFRDELMGFLGSLDKKGQEVAREFYLESWNGTTDYPVDRVMRGEVMAKEVCLSIAGTTQPEKIALYLQKNLHTLANDGFLQRFQLLVYPDPKSWILIDQYPDSQAKKMYQAVCKKLIMMDFIAHGAIKDEPFYEGQEVTPHYRFSATAQPFFNDWIQKLQTKIEHEPENILKEHLSKYRSLMPSLALIDHLISITEKMISANTHDSGDVPLDSAQRAAALCEYLEAHARRIYGIVLQESCKKSRKLSSTDALLVWMTRYHQQKGQTLFTYRFMLKNSKFRDSKSLKPVVADLLAMDCIQLVDEKTFRLVTKSDSYSSLQTLPETLERSPEASLISIEDTHMHKSTDSVDRVRVIV